MSDKPITLAVITRNRHRHVETAVRAIVEARRRRNAEVLVLDNASTPPVQWSGPEPVRVIRHPTNLGFCGNYKSAVSSALTFIVAFGLTKAVAFEYGPLGITSNAICPHDSAAWSKAITTRPAIEQAVMK